MLAGLKLHQVSWNFPVYEVDHGFDSFECLVMLVLKHGTSVCQHFKKLLRSGGYHHNMRKLELNGLGCFWNALEERAFPSSVYPHPLWTLFKHILILPVFWKYWCKQLHCYLSYSFPISAMNFIFFTRFLSIWLFKVTYLSLCILPDSRTVMAILGKFLFSIIFLSMGLFQFVTLKWRTPSSMKRSF